MVGPTAQLVSLACYFNARARGFPPGPLFLTNSTSQFCEYIHFVRLYGAQWKITEATVEDWLAMEARPDRRAILTSQHRKGPLEDRKTAGLIGGGVRWLLNIVANGHADVWEAVWEVGNKQAPDRRIWRVTHPLIAGNVSFALPAPPSPESLIQALQETLSDLLTFCAHHNLDAFALNFQKARDCLSSGGPFALVYHKDLAPADFFRLPAKQLLATCQAAWVFGGMGSWNDMGFEGRDQSRYEELSAKLYALLNHAIAVGANSAAVL